MPTQPPTQPTPDHADGQTTASTWNRQLYGGTRTRSARARSAHLAAEQAAARSERAVAVEQERLRTARELQDVIAHHLTAILALTQGAQALRTDTATAADTDTDTDARTAAVAAALEHIGTLGREALGDTRDILTRLHATDNTSQTDPVALLIQLRHLTPHPTTDPAHPAGSAPPPPATHPARTTT